MKKILFYSTDVRQPTGYARISYKLLNHLAEDENNDIYHFAISDFKELRVERQLNPRIKVINALEEDKKINSEELYGVDIIKKFIDIIKPDVVFIYNDLVVVCRLFNELAEHKKNNNYKIYVYIDLVYEYEKYKYIEFMDRNSDLIYTFSDIWKDNLIKMNVNPNKIKILYHGINTDQIFKIDKLEARKRLGLDNNDFIILNTNRNSYRKNWETTISAFLIFLKRNNYNPRIKLYINCVLNLTHSYDLFDIIKISCLKYDMDYFKTVSTHIIHYANKQTGTLSDETLNLIYNACDIGINTCVGEGVGLCNLEHAYLGAPQIVSNVGGLKDIFKNGYSILIEPKTNYYIGSSIDDHGGYISITDPNDFANAINEYYKKPKKLINDSCNIQKDIKTRFMWDDILKNFNI